MKTWPVLVAVILFLPSCATMPSASGKGLASGIREHAFTTRRALILGDGVSPETAAKVSGQSFAMVLYCPYRSKSVDIGKTKPAASTFMRDVMASLRAMAGSGDAWEVAVAERSRTQVRMALKLMRARELSSFSGKLVLPERARSDRILLEQVERVFGEGVLVDFVGSPEP